MHRKHLNFFHSPVFIDRKFTFGSNTITHASSIITTNTIIIMKFVLCESIMEDTRVLLNKLLHKETMFHTIDKGEATLYGVRRMGRRYGNMSYMWLAAKQPLQGNLMMKTAY